jgi:hypothetical protein
MRTFILLACFTGLLLAVPVGLEPVTVTASDGTEQTYLRINTGTGPAFPGRHRRALGRPQPPGRHLPVHRPVR